MAVFERQLRAIKCNTSEGAYLLTEAPFVELTKGDALQESSMALPVGAHGRQTS